MSSNGHNQGVVVTSGARVRASGPILILAFLFVFAVFLSWYFSWFGRGLSDVEITEYLNDEKHPRHVQHALLQIQQRLEKRDMSARQWYPRIISLATNPETEFRLTVAWLMGSDNQSQEFHQALGRLLQDSAPIVRRNAALALLRFNDLSGRQELLAILEPYVIPAPKAGVVSSTLQPGSWLTRGTLLGRIQNSDGTILEVRSPLPGKLEQTLVTSGATVTPGAPFVTITSDDESVWEALRGLAIAGQPADLAVVERYLSKNPGVSDRIKEQAVLTTNSIAARPTATRETQ